MLAKMREPLLGTVSSKRAQLFSRIGCVSLPLSQRSPTPTHLPQIRKLEVELRLSKKGDGSSGSANNASAGEENLDEKVAILEV
jgi:hypothetical protein